MAQYKARVYTTLRPEYADIRGIALLSELRGLGYTEVKSVKTSKLIEIDLEAEPGKAHEQVNKMCRQLLAHPATEEFTITIAEVSVYNVDEIVPVVAEPPEPIMVHPTPEPKIEPPSFFRLHNTKALDLVNHKLEFGLLSFIRAEWHVLYPRFVVIRYFIGGRHAARPLRLDLEKLRFLDDLDYWGLGMDIQQVELVEKQYAGFKEDAARQVAEVVIAGLRAVHDYADPPV